MKRFKSSIVAKIAVVSALSFWALYIFTTWNQLQEISSSAVLATTFAIVVRWLPKAFTSLRYGREGFNFLIFGVFSLATSILVYFTWIKSYRWAGRPEYLLYSPISSLCAWIIATACVLIVLAPDTEEGNIPRSNIYWLVAAAFLAGSIAGASIMLYVPDRITLDIL